MTMKNRFRIALALALALLAVPVALADGPSVTGGYVPQIQYATSAALNLFVDPTGNDNGQCLATGTGACATPDGALARVPYRIKNTVTITIAAGTYAIGMHVANHAFESGGQLSINGLMVGATLATGTNTGAVTAVSNPAIGPSTVTDSAQTWTASALKGMYLEMTNGTANNIRRVIVDNTSTVLTLANGYATAPAVGNTYAIRVPGVVLNGTPALSVLNMAASGGTTSSNNGVLIGAGVTASAATGCVVGGTGAITVSLERTQCISSAGGTPGLSVSTAQNVSLNNAFLQSTNSSGPALLMGNYAGVTVQQSVYATSPSVTANGSTGTVEVGNYSVLRIGTGMTVQNTSTVGVPIRISYNGSVIFTGVESALASQLNLICQASGTTSVGIWLPYIAITSGTTSPTGAATAVMVTNLSTSNCVTAVQSDTPGAYVLVSAATINTSTNGFSVHSGGKISLFTRAPTFNTVTNQLVVEGVNYTYSTAMTGSSGISDLSTGSSIEK